MKYKKLYEKALVKTTGHFKGYQGGNALSLWVFEKYGVNAAASSEAHDALCEVLRASSFSLCLNPFSQVN